MKKKFSNKKSTYEREMETPAFKKAFNAEYKKKFAKTHSETIRTVMAVVTVVL